MVNNGAGQERELTCEKEIIAGIAHEIKNPLAAMHGFLQLLGHRVEADATSYRYVQMVMSELDRLQELVEDYLCYDRVKVSSFTLCDVSEIVDRVALLLNQDAMRRNVEIKVKKTFCPPIEVAPKLLYQLLWNLTTNALAAMPGRGEIILELILADSNWLKLTCRDTGAGISPAVLPQIFRPYFTTKEDGTGLGLAISRIIAEFHGGRLEAESELGSGTTFTLWLPTKRDTMRQ